MLRRNLLKGFKSNVSIVPCQSLHNGMGQIAPACEMPASFQNQTTVRDFFDRDLKQILGERQIYPINANRPGRMGIGKHKWLFSRVFTFANNAKYERSDAGMDIDVYLTHHVARG